MRVCAVVLLLVSGCEKLEEVTYCQDTRPTLPTHQGDTPTWEGNIRELMQRNCGSCHQPSGPTPILFEAYEDVTAYSDAIRSAVSSGRMPPWGAAPCCKSYKASRAMPDQERAMLLAWLDAGAPSGSNTPSLLTPSTPPALSRVDLTLEMPEAFTPDPAEGTEEQRCFMVDWPETSDLFMTGLHVEPGTRQSVHHVIIYHPTDAREISQYEDMDGADGRPGWPCEGGRLGASTLLPPQGLGGWSPGSFPMDYPDGLGVKIPAGGKVIFQMHYTIDHGVFADRTRLHFKLEDSVDAEIYLLTVMDWNWALLPGDFIIPAGEKGTRYQLTQALNVPSGYWNHVYPLKLYTVTLHMHEFGTRSRISVEHDDGTSDCLLEIPEWSKEFMGDYWLEDPLLVRPGDKFFLECVYDNSSENQPTENGTRREPRDLTWDEDGEMCAAFVTIAGVPVK